MKNAKVSASKVWELGNDISMTASELVGVADLLDVLNEKAFNYEVKSYWGAFNTLSNSVRDIEQRIQNINELLLESVLTARMKKEE